MQNSVTASIETFAFGLMQFHQGNVLTDTSAIKEVNDWALFIELHTPKWKTKKFHVCSGSLCVIQRKAGSALVLSSMPSVLPEEKGI